jgi:hypothetical protein
MSKPLNTIIFFIIIAGWILLVNALNFTMSVKYILYLFVLIFLGAWFIYIVKS